jgi:hypothetical protein
VESKKGDFQRAFLDSFGTDYQSFLDAFTTAFAFLTLRFFEGSNIQNDVETQTKFKGRSCNFEMAG